MGKGRSLILIFSHLNVNLKTPVLNYGKTRHIRWQEYWNAEILSLNW